ncbi:MAG: enoyl-CoA hydratase/isomerase family protein [Promethearchaeota archaeon]
MIEIKDLSSFEHIKVELPKKVDAEGNVIQEGIDGNYAVISINRPDKLNAMTIQTMRELSEAFEALEFDETIRCVVLRGTKDYTKKPSFCVGQDLQAVFSPEVKLNIPWHMPNIIQRYHRYFSIIEDFPKPIIAAVDGFALGGGTEMTLLCDIIIASKRSSFGFSEIKRGIFPAAGGTQRMVRYIGLARTTRMLYFGETFPAETMYDWGLVTFLVDDDNFEDFVHKKAKELGESATTSLIVMKRCVKLGTQVPLKIGLQLEQLGMGVNFQSADTKEGVIAFSRRIKCPVCKGKGKMADGSKCMNCDGRRRIKDTPHFKGI